MIGKIATSAVYVTDQEAALQFWGEQVGFEIRRDLPMAPKRDGLKWRRRVPNPVSSFTQKT